MFTAILGTLGFSALAGLLVAVMVTPAIAVTGVTVNSTIGIFDSLPDFIELNQLPQQNRIYAKTGATDANGEPEYTQIATVFDQNREEVDWDQVSPHLKAAAVSGEDRRFYEHGGIDLAGIARAVVGNVVSGGIQSGASTITQQLVKNIFVQEAAQAETDEERKRLYEQATDQSIQRKLKEMKLAIALEKNHSKEEILLAYLNISHFGETTYGVQAAAQRYFQTTAADVTPEQAASLIAMVQEPSALNLAEPENYAANEKRRNVILGWMYAEGNLTKTEYDAARAVPVDETTVSLEPLKNGCLAAETHSKFFCDYITKLVPELAALGNDETERREKWQTGGYDIYTTLDLPAQQVAQQQLWTYTPAEEDRLQLGSAATSVQVGTGNILVMAQNKHFDNTADGGGPAATAVNFNTTKEYGGSSGFQPGSTYKTFVLINWLQRGHGLNEMVNANPRTESLSTFTDTCNGPYSDGGAGGPWKFKNSAGETGSRTVAAATAGSVNGAFVTMAQQLDLCEIGQVAEDLGVRPAGGGPLATYPSSVLGSAVTVAPVTMAAAYATIASGGTYCKPRAVEKVISPQGEELPGEEVQCHTALEADVANTTAHALQGVINGGTGYSANTRDGVELFGKTGTTDSANQLWFSGGSRSVATSLWIGNIVGEYKISRYNSHGMNGQPLRNFIWKQIMLTMNERYGGEDFPGPAPHLLRGTGITVPDLLGQTIASATVQLEAAGLTVEVGAPVSSPHPEGTVGGMDPGVGALLGLGSKVTLHPSDGSQGGVPDVVGDGTNTYSDAVDILAAAGFQNVNQQCQVLDPEDATQDGFVISSNPAAGATANRNSAIRVTVGKIVCG